MDRAHWRGSCESAVESLKYDAFRSWSLNGIHASLVHHTPATLSARSATGCVLHGSGFLPTTSPTRDDGPVVSTAQSINPRSTVLIQLVSCLIDAQPLPAHSPPADDNSLNGCTSHELTDDWSLASTHFVDSQYAFRCSFGCVLLLNQMFR